MKKIINIYSLFTLILLNSCLLPNEKGQVTMKLPEGLVGASTEPSIEDIKLIDDQIKVRGIDLDVIVNVKLGESPLSILSQTKDEIILSATNKVMIVLDTLLTLTFEGAYGSTVVDVKFNLEDDSVETDMLVDGSVTADKLDAMGASAGQILRWNGTAWVAEDFNAMFYAGAWDPSVPVPSEPNSAAVGGEYYIVSASATNVDINDGSGARDWNQGDWIVFNSTTSQWDQLTNSTGVSSFNTRAGAIIPAANDYTWAQIDKTTSSIGDITDVNLSSAPTDGQVLKYDFTNSEWVAADDADSGVADGSVDSDAIQDDSVTAAKIADDAVDTAQLADGAVETASINADAVTSAKIDDGTIVDADINASAAITATKIGAGNVDNTELGYLNGVTSAIQTQLNGKVDITGDTMTGTLNVPANGFKIGTDQMVASGGYIGIGTASPTAELEVDGDIKFSGTITDVSDRRLKEEIEPIEDSLDRIRMAKAYSYVMRNDEKKRLEYGFMAQDFLHIFPELVHVGNDGYLSLNYMGLIPWTVQAIQEVDEEVQKIKEENIRLKARVESLEAEFKLMREEFKKVLSKK